MQKNLETSEAILISLKDVIERCELIAHNVKGRDVIIGKLQVILASLQEGKILTKKDIAEMQASYDSEEGDIIFLGDVIEAKLDLSSEVFDKRHKGGF